MTLEQEVASVAAFAIREAGGPNRYYYRVPEEFHYPAIYFPAPEIRTRGETFRTYAAQYVWYIDIHCVTTEEAHERARSVVHAVRRVRNRIPLLNTDGSDSGETLRTTDPTTVKVDNGVCQVRLEWTSRRPYDEPEHTMAASVIPMLGVKD